VVGLGFRLQLELCQFL
jgi:hypothetical protein